MKQQQCGHLTKREVSVCHPATATFTSVAASVHPYPVFESELSPLVMASDLLYQFTDPQAHVTEAWLDVCDGKYWIGCSLASCI